MSNKNRNRDFISEIKTIGLARTNRFTVNLTPPASNPATTRRVMLFCETASLPGLNYATTQNRSFGEFREVPYDKLFENITLRFHVDKNMEVKKLFDNWMHMIQNPITRTFNYYNEYTTDMVVEVQDLQDLSTYQVQLYEVYPKSIGSVSLDAEAKDTMRMDVSFQYKYWMSNGIQETLSGQKLTTDQVDKYYKDFSGFQEKLKKGLGERGYGIATGVVGQYAQRAFSQVTSRIPSIKF